jgi:hypothetical protein
VQRRTPTRIGLPPNLKALYIERYPEIRPYKMVAYVGPDRALHSAGYWLLPIHTSPDRELGTFLRLYDDGKIEQVTLRPDDPGEDVVLIKPEDKKDGM